MIGFQKSHVYSQSLTRREIMDSDKLLVFLALTSLFSGCAGLLLMVTNEYSLFEAATSVAYLIIGIYFTHRYRHRRE
ncbi:MAG: hypothetical protein J07HQX50_01616 [Haloquadratum sp. J07HQX50]|nr:MAG: hypothetical protein J07HQX50_01616 [Haloquadratum sp. J07HQX50]